MNDHPVNRLAVLGASFREAGFEHLAQLTLAPAADEAGRAGRLALAERLGARELVYLATCNRVECYAVLERPTCPRELKSRIQRAFPAVPLEDEQVVVKQGLAAAEHLFRVVAGLESLVIGETEIAGQARRALDESRQLSLAAPGKRGLAQLFEQALACNRRVRGETRLGELTDSVASLAVKKIKKHFGKPGPALSVLVGVGPMTEQVARVLASYGDERSRTLVVNRTVSRAADMIERVGGQARMTALGLDEFLAQPPVGIELVFSATSASEVVVPREALLPSLAGLAPDTERPLIVCDLGVPRDTDPVLEEEPAALVVTMDHMESLARLNRGQLEAEVVKARTLVETELGRLEREARFVSLAENSARSMIDSQLGHLSEADRAAIVKFAQQLGTRMARQPGELSLRAPEQADQGPPQASEAPTPGAKRPGRCPIRRRSEPR